MRSFLLTLSIVVIGLSVVQAAEPAAGKQVEQVLDCGSDGSIPYLLYLPKQYEATADKKWPVMLFLHGRGESDGPLSVVAKWGPPRRVEHGEELPYILVSPQCPRTNSWSQPVEQKLLERLLEQVLTSFRADNDRVYLTGLSMGGFGSWTMAANHPEKFAAVVPICGGGSPEGAAKLKWLPIWVFHGTDDPAVPLKRSEEMVEAVKAAGNSTIRFTTLEHIGHNSWEAAYATPDLYEWLKQQTASANRARREKPAQ